MNSFIIELVEIGNNINQNSILLKGNREEIHDLLIGALNKSKSRSLKLNNSEHINETEYLLSSKENKTRLNESIKNIREGKTTVHKLIEPLKGHTLNSQAIGRAKRKKSNQEVKEWSQEKIDEVADVISKVAFQVMQETGNSIDLSSISKPKTPERILADVEDNPNIVLTYEEAVFIAEKLNTPSKPNDNLRNAFEQYQEMLKDPKKLNDLLSIPKEEDSIDYVEFEQRIREMSTVDTLVFENLVIDSSIGFDEIDGSEHKEYCVSFTDQGGTNCFSSVKDVVQFAKDWSNFKC